MASPSAAGSNRRIARDFLLGILLTAVAAALAWHFYPGPWQQPADAELQRALQQREALRAQAQLAAAEAARTAAAVPVAPSGPCDFEAIVPAASPADGQGRGEHPFPAGPSARAKVFLRAAEVAAAQGRPRDAELKLIAACRQEARSAGGANAPLARVLGLLGAHYAAAAGRESSSLAQEELLARARQVLAASAELYAKALGPNASRTHQARQRLAALDAQPLVVEGAPLAPEAAAVRTAAQSTPSAPLRPTRSAPEPEAVPPPLAEPDLRQLADDLERLRAQAAAVSGDPAGMRQRTQRARAQREQCRGDTACLRDWYERRRRQLLAEF